MSMAGELWGTVSVLTSAIKSKPQMGMREFCMERAAASLSNSGKFKGITFNYIHYKFKTTFVPQLIVSKV